MARRIGSQSTHEFFYGLGPKMTPEQNIYLANIYSKQMVVVNAKAGTGKTVVAVAAAKSLADTKGMGLVYVFPPVEEDQMGFRSGNQHAKNIEYLRPLYDALLEIGELPDRAIRTDDYDPEKDKEGRAWVEAMPHTFMRGSNIKAKVVILAEAQNWTKPQLKKALTRLHDSSIVIVEGHMGQCDLRNDKGKVDPSLSGFPALIEHFQDKPYAAFCTLTKCFRGVLAQDADEM